jgi:hypothetical protein
MDRHDAGEITQAKFNVTEQGAGIHSAFRHQAAALI